MQQKILQVLLSSEALDVAYRHTEAEPERPKPLFSKHGTVLERSITSDKPKILSKRSIESEELGFKEFSISGNHQGDTTINQDEMHQNLIPMENSKSPLSC